VERARAALLVTRETPGREANKRRRPYQYHRCLRCWRALPVSSSLGRWVVPAFSQSSRCPTTPISHLFTQPTYTSACPLPASCSGAARLLFNFEAFKEAAAAAVSLLCSEPAVWWQPE